MVDCIVYKGGVAERREGGEGKTGDKWFGKMIWIDRVGGRIN